MTAPTGWIQTLRCSRISNVKSAACPWKLNRRASPTSLHYSVAHDNPEQQGRNAPVHHFFLDRRKAVQATLTSISLVSTTLALSPCSSIADDSLLPDASQILLRLKSIPTFCVVDPKGVPFMIFDGQASATGYFFLSFDIAAQALADAKRKDNNVGAAAIWEQARIIVVPLAVALQVSLRKSQRVAINNGIRFNTYGDIVPSQEGIDDAKAFDSSSLGSTLSNKWEQKGRVPLFFIAGLKLENGREPRYFNRRDLLKEWYRQHPDPAIPSPRIQIVEMVELYRLALSGKNSDLSAIQNLTIMPVVESYQVASQLLQQQPKDNPLPKYDFNTVYLVGSAQG
jgi:hypothetical protein